MGVADFLKEAGEGVAKGAKAAGGVALPIAERTAQVVSGEAPQIDEEKRQQQIKLDDQQIAAKEQELTSQLELGRKYGTLTSDQQQQYVDQISQLYSHPRHAGTLMEKLRQAVHPNGMVATPGAASLKSATPAGGTAGADERNKLTSLTDQDELGKQQAQKSIDWFKTTMLPLFPPDQQASKLNEYIDHINGITQGAEKPPKGLKAMEQGGAFFGIQDQDTGKQYLVPQLAPGGDAPPEAKQMYAAVQKELADKDATADKKEKEAEDRQKRQFEHSTQMMVMGLEKSIELGNIREAQQTLRDADKQYQTSMNLADDMMQNAPAAKNGDQQAQLAILADHAGGTTKLAGGRLTRDVMKSITDSLPWLDKVKKQWATDPSTGIEYLSGITLSPDQIDKMINVARIRAQVTKDGVDQIKSDHPELSGDTGIKPIAKPGGVARALAPVGKVGGASKPKPQGAVGTVVYQGKTYWVDAEKNNLGEK